MQLSKEIFEKLKGSVSFFSSFTDGELIALLKLAETETFSAEQVIFKEKTKGDKMYIILAGAVRISRAIGNKKEEVLVILKPGACFGEMGVIDQSPRSASATVDGGNAILLSLKDSLLSQRNVLLAYKLYKNFSIMLAGRMRETNDKLQEASAGDRTSSSQLKELLKKKIEKGASFQGANLKGVDLSGAFLNNANMEYSILVGAQFSDTKCKQTNFNNTRLVAAKFNRVDFEGSNFQNADFTGSTFKEVTFTSCNMAGAKFYGADLTEAEMEELKISPEDNPRGTNS